MNSVVAISFVVIATIFGKWLLFDDDRPQEISDEGLDLKIADSSCEPQTKTSSPPYSKSA